MGKWRPRKVRWCAHGSKTGVNLEGFFPLYISRIVWSNLEATSPMWVTIFKLTQNNSNSVPQLQKRLTSVMLGSADNKRFLLHSRKFYWRVQFWSLVDSVSSWEETSVCVYIFYFYQMTGHLRDKSCWVVFNPRILCPVKLSFMCGSNKQLKKSYHL